MPQKLYPRTALALLTALNLLNYIDRSVLFAVQDLVKAEFHRSDAAFGLLTSVFFIFYMCAAPFMGPLSVRFSRKAVIIAGTLVWSAATLLTAITRNFDQLLIRHTLVGIGEASFVILSPTFVADMFPEDKSGRGDGNFLSCDSGRHRSGLSAGRNYGAEVRVARAVLHWRGAGNAAGTYVLVYSGASTGAVR